MSEQVVTYSAKSASVGLVGRTLNSIRQHHFVIDSPGINEAINSAEIFLVGLSSCGVTLIENVAQGLGIRVTRVEVQIDGFRRPEVAAFDRIDMRFTLVGPSDAEAAVLIDRYRNG